MLSNHAILAIEQLHGSWFVNWMVRGSIHDPSMGGSTHHPNWRFFTAMERYLSVQQVCHAGDTLNSYCDSILAEILASRPVEWDKVKTLLRRSDLRDTIERLRNHRQFGAREALRDGITTFWSPESDVIIMLRNKLVHQSGRDKDREVDKMVMSKSGQKCPIPPVDLEEGVIPIAYSGDDLVVDAQTGVWACRHVENHIHFMDQNLCYRFSLPRKRHRMRQIKFAGYGDKGALPFPPGTPLPTVGPPRQIWTIPDTPVINPDYSMIPDQREIDCAQTRLLARQELDKVFRSYCDEAGIAIVGISGGMPGSLLPHTIRWHDLNLVYQVQEKDGTDDRGYQVEIRIREKDWDPFLTIFGHNTQMKDFPLSSGYDNAIEYLKTCIDRALQA